MAQTLAVGMTLSLTDTASPQIKGLTGLLEQLQGVVTALSTRLDALVGGISGLQSAGTSAAGVMDRLSASAAAAAASITEAGAAMSGVGAATEGAAGKMAVARGEMAALGGEASNLMGTLKGMAEIWGAFKIEKGLKESASAAIEYQNTVARLTNMNVGAGAQAEMIAAANRTSATVPQFSKNDTLEMAIDLRNAMGTAEHAVEMLTDFAKAAFDMRMATPRGQSFNDRDMLLIAKALEQRGVTLDPTEMRRELDVFTQIYTATQGRVNAQQILGNLQYSKGGLGQTMDVDFLPYFAAMIEQIRSQGGQGGQIGTWLTTLQNAVVGGRGDASSIKERARLGLVNPDDIVFNRQGNVDLQKSDKTGAGAKDFLQNPFVWAQTILRPALERAKIDVTAAIAGDKKAMAEVNAEILKLYKDRNAANAAAMMLLRQPLLEKDAQNIRQTFGVEGQYQNNIQTTQAQLDALMARLKNVGIELGGSMLPVINKVTAGLVAMAEQMAHVFQNPFIAGVTAIVAGLGSIALAVAGTTKLFGVLGLATGEGGALGIALATGARLLLRFAGIWGAALLAMDLLDLVGNWEVGGKTVYKWLGDFMDSIVDTIKNGWIRAKQYFGFISVEAANAQIAANNAARAQAGLPKAGEKVGPIVSQRESGGQIINPPTESPPNPNDKRYETSPNLFGGTDVSNKPPRFGAPRGPREQSQIPQIQNDLKALQDAFNQEKLAQGSFQTWSIEQTRDYWENVLDQTNLSAKDRISASNKYYDAERQVQQKDFQAYIASLEAQITAAGHHVDQKIALAEKEYQAEVQRYGELSTQAQNAYKKIEQYRKELADQNARIAEIEGAMDVAKFKHGIDMSKLQADQDLAMRRISNEQRLQIEQQALDAEYQQARDQQVKLMEIEVDRDPVKYEELKRQLLTIDQDYETKKTQLIQQQEKERAQAAIDAANATQNAFSGFLNDLASGKGFKAALDNFAKSVQSSIVKTASDQVAKQLFGPGTTGGDWINKLTQGIFGGGSGGSGIFGSIGDWFKGLFGGGSSSNGASITGTGFDNPFLSLFGIPTLGGAGVSGAATLTTAGTTLTTASTMLTTAATQLQAAASALASSAGFGGFGGGGGLFSGTGGLFGADEAGAFTDPFLSGFGIPTLGGFASGIDYVPRDMIAMIHEGERIVPKAQNMAGAGMGMPDMHFHFNGPVDSRSRSQVAAGVYEGMSRYAQRIR